MTIRTRRGNAKLNKWGTLQLKRTPAAINAEDVGETLTISPPNVTIDIPTLGGSWAALRLVWRGRINGVRSTHVFPIPLVEGLQTLGTVEDVLGPLLGLTTKYEIQIVDSSGRIGYSTGIKTAAGETGNENTIPTLSNVVASGSGYTGDSHSVTYSVDGLPAPTITYQWERDGTPIGGATSSTYSPDTAGSHTCVVTATNTEGAVSEESNAIAVVAEVAPQLATVGISGSGTINTLHAATYTEAVTAVPAATATYVWELDGTPIGGATASTYTPASTGDLTVVVTLTNAAGSDDLESSAKTISNTSSNVAPDITAGTISGTTAAGSVHGITGLTYIGTPVPTLTYQWKLNGVNAPAPSTSATYTSPANSTAALTCTITATNVAGSDNWTTPAITLVPVTPPQPVAADWDIQTSSPSVGVTEWDTITLAESLGATEVQWTTTALATDAEAEAAGEFATMNLQGTANGKQTWVLPDLVVNGRYFNRFDPSTYPGDSTRAGRASIRYKTASDVRSPRAAVKQIQLNTNTRWQVGGWVPFHLRTQEQYWGGPLTTTNSEGQVVATEQGTPKPAGGGYQFFRSWANSAADPDFLFATMDVSIPQCSYDFGGWWQNPKMRGLKAGVSGQSCAIDPTDGNRILVLHSAGSQRGASGSLNDWDKHTGMYLSTDKGATFTLVKQINSLGGSASNDNDETNVRYMQHVICPDADAVGTTAANRVWWAVVHIMPKDSTTTKSIVIKSTNGGTSWTEEGELSAATFGMPIMLRRHKVDGNWWLATRKGLFRSSTTPAGTWTNISNQTGGLTNDTFVTEIDCDGAAGEVWACVRNVGLYKTTDGTAATPGWTAKKSWNKIQTFAISPHDRNLILIAGDNGEQKAQRTRDGGTNWDTVSNSSMLGQPEGFQSYVQGTHAYFVFHKTNPAKCFVARFQHHGIINNVNTTTTNGATTTWASANFDYFWLHDFGWDPDNWKNAVCSVTDRVAIYGVDGFNYVTDDSVDDTVKLAVWQEMRTAGVYTDQTSKHMGACRGGLILRNDTNSRVAIFTGVGSSQAGASRQIVRHSSGTVGGETSAIGTVQTGFEHYGAQWCNFGVNDPTAKNVGYIGRNRLVLNSNNTISQTDTGKEIIGIDSAGFVYGIDKGGTSTKIWKSSVKPTGSAITWNEWTDMSYQPGRSIDNEPRGISWDATDANGRIFAACNQGRFVIAENGVSRVVATTATLPGSGAAGAPPLFPSVQGYMCALDPNSTAAYITLNRYGGSVAYKTADITVTDPVWVDITGDFLPPCCGKIYCHPVTSDVIFSYQSGNYIYPAHVKQANSLYDLVVANISKYQL